ncbi:unnamed protein product [Sphagnum balticum]
MEGRRTRSRGVDVRKPEIKAEETPQPTTTIYEEEEEEEDDGTLDGGVGLRNSNGRDHGFLPLLRGENKRKRDPRGGPTRNLKQKKGADMENADSSRKTDGHVLSTAGDSLIRDEEVVSNLDSGGKDEEDTEEDIRKKGWRGDENKELPTADIAAGDDLASQAKDQQKRRESSRHRVRPSKFRESFPILAGGKVKGGESKVKNDIFSSLEIVLPINATPNMVPKDHIHRPVHDDEVHEEVHEAAATIKTGKKKDSSKGKSLTPVASKDKQLSTSAAADDSRSLDKSRLKTVLGLLKRVMKMSEAEPFNEPVDPVALGIPDYFTIVKKPMDLGTIRNRLEKGEVYRTVEEVLEDVALVWSNCRMYNAKGDPILDFLHAVEATFSTLCLAAGFLFPSPAPGNGTSSMKTSSEQQRESQNPKKKKKKKVASWLKTKVKRSAPVEQVMAESKAREQKEHAEVLDITEQLKDVENTTTEHVIEQTHATSGAHVEGRDQEMEDLGNNHDKMDSSPGSLQADETADSKHAEGKDLHFPHVNAIGRPRKSNVASTHKMGCLCVICGGTRHKLRGRKKKGRIPIQNKTIFRKKIKIPKAVHIEQERERANALEDVDGGEDFVVENHSEHLFEACPSSDNAQGYHAASYQLPPQRLTPAVHRMTCILFGSSAGSIWNQPRSLGYIPLPPSRKLGLMQAVKSLTPKK